MVPMDAEAIRAKFLVDESQLEREHLKTFEGRVAFDKTGRVMVRDAKQYRDRDRVALMLAGRALAHAAGAATTESVAARDVAESLGMDEAVVAARLSDLVREGQVDRSGRGQYRARLARIASAMAPPGGDVDGA